MTGSSRSAGGDRALEPWRVLSQGRPPLRRRAAGRRRAATLRRASTSSAASENGPSVRRIAASSGPASAGIVRARSPRPELDSIAGRGQPQQRPGRHRQRRVGGDRRRVQRPEPGRRLAPPHLLGHPPAQRQRIEVRREAIETRRVDGLGRDRLAQPPAATASSTACRTACCHVGATMPMVRCDDADSTVSAACGNPAGGTGSRRRSA